MKFRNYVVMTLTATTLFAGCASKIQKADINPAANPSSEIARLDQAVAEGHNRHLDVLANKEFTKAQKHLKEAKEDLADNDDQKDILEEVAYSQAYLDKAQQLGDERRVKVEAVLEARQKAIVAGAHNHGPTQKELKKIDDDMRGDSSNFDKLDSAEMAKLQERYLNLELVAVTATQLGDARSRIEAAKDAKAARYTPATLKQAEIDFATAENKIRANRNMTQNFSADVANANQSALILTATLAATNGGRVDEGTAQKLVAQDQALMAKERQISSLNNNLEQATSTQGQLQNQVANQNARLSAAQAAVNMQKSIDLARQQFSEKEAEVFQQGDKLLIRLKAMNFPSGSANIPQASVELLGKVRDVAATLNPSEVVIEGHTDSVGKKDVNEKLSEARAESVAKYMETNGLEKAKIEAVGYGFDKPIASNKTKAGREQNRRVDVIVTPGNGSNQEQAPSSSVE